MKAFVNQNKCMFCGLCGGVCPEIFVVDLDHRKSISLDEELTEELLALARHAESICPKMAIAIINDPPTNKE